MASRLFLLDGMALAYRAHFAMAVRPIRTSARKNTSALFGFANTLLDILAKEAPTHLAVAFDTEAPTARHDAYPAYKAQREAMPEELSDALPDLRRWLEAFQIPALSLDGYEADDLIGTLVHQAESEGFHSFMVTPDKDFGQLVTDRTRLWKPGRQGGDAEILGPAEVCARWGITRVDQVIDMLSLMGDTSDNIPGIPGVGEKTAAKLLARYDNLEGVLAHADEVPGKVGQALREHAELARLCRRLVTIQIDVPIRDRLQDLACRERDDEAVRALCVEFEFNALGRRLFGEAFKAGRGFKRPKANLKSETQGTLFAEVMPPPPGSESTPEPTAMEETGGGATSAVLKTLADVPHTYRLVQTPAERRALVEELKRGEAFCFDTETDGLDPKTARLLGVALSAQAGHGWYLPIEPGDVVTEDAGDGALRRNPAPGGALADLAPLLLDPRLLKVGHNLKFDLLILRWHGIEVPGPFFDTMIAHALIDPERRHGMDYLAEALLGYSPVPIERLIGPAGPDQKTMDTVPLKAVAEYAAEDADITWQLRAHLAPILEQQGLQRVFAEVEMPVLPALVAMEHEGIRIDVTALKEFSAELAAEMARAEADLHRLAGREFNVNSNKQLGQVLFDELRLVERPKKTPTGQYATDEPTLQGLAGDHEIVRRLLDYRTVAKLKSTYADALPASVFPGSGRVHTTFHQAATATGRLSSADPNLQNIPIRTELGQEIRRAFVPREGWRLLSADYSQIELRIIAALSGETAMIEAFRRGEDIHTATAARVFGVALPEVTAEMRRRAKMVNFGIAYGISAFGLAQRLGIPRGEAAEIIDHYFTSYPGIRRYMDETIQRARERGFVETLTGRRRHLPDVRSANATVRGAAERNAINTPIQGTAADMIKIAMGRIHADLRARGCRTQLLLQVHDELVFDLHPDEEPVIRPLVEEGMRHALPLPGDVPIVVEVGIGTNWRAAH